MKRIAALAAGLALSLAGLWWALERDREPRIVEAGEPLLFDEPVKMRWVDEGSGEEEIWEVVKRDTSPEDRLAARPLPEPDPRAADREPDESARALNAMALQAWKAGEIVEARRQLEQAVAIDPDDPLPRTHLGRLMVLSMDYQEAIPHLERAAELNPDDPQVWLDLATVHQKRLSLESSWEARRRADALAAGREIRQDEVSGFWVLEDNSIYP